MEILEIVIEEEIEYALKHILLEDGDGDALGVVVGDGVTRLVTFPFFQSVPTRSTT
jgi:hypothetical protein